MSQSWRDPTSGAAAGNACAEALASVPAAEVEWERAAAAVRDASAADGRFAADFLTTSVRRIIAAWEAAVGGDETGLAAVARPAAVQMLLHPPQSGADGERTQVVVRHLRVTGITFRWIDAAAIPPTVSIWFAYSGRRYIEGVDPASTRAGSRDTEDRFADTWTLTLDGAPPWPWRLAEGSSGGLFSFLGYTFVSRRETPEEYRTRVSAGTSGPGGTGPGGAAPAGRRFEIHASFAEHDEKISGSAMTVVERETGPGREEAGELVNPAIYAETTRRLGAGDWFPSLNYLEVRELLAGPPASGQGTPAE